MLIICPCEDVPTSHLNRSLNFHLKLSFDRLVHREMPIMICKELMQTIDRMFNVRVHEIRKHKRFIQDLLKILLCLLQNILCLLFLSLLKTYRSVC